MTFLVGYNLIYMNRETERRSMIVKARNKQDAIHMCEAEASRKFPNVLSVKAHDILAG